LKLRNRGGVIIAHPAAKLKGRQDKVTRRQQPYL
jgi:hypothetical protein